MYPFLDVKNTFYGDDNLDIFNFQSQNTKKNITKSFGSF